MVSNFHDFVMDQCVCSWFPEVGFDFVRRYLNAGSYQNEVVRKIAAEVESDTMLGVLQNHGLNPQKDKT